MLKKLCLGICLLANGLHLTAQLQSPDDFLPHSLGENFTPHHLLVDYFEHVADNSDRVQLQRYGYTNEDRPLMVAFISTPENLNRLEDIRKNNLRKAGLLEGKVDPDLNISIVWMSYSVHGNETAGNESSMGVVYELSRPDKPETKGWLENTLVILDPVLNPDGNSRYIDWYRRNTNKITNPNPNVREHDEPWPGGRVNHYLYDLNRDWAWQTQIESQQRMKLYRQWYPQIHADLHEQFYNDPYYFAPAARPYHEYITDWQSKFQVEIGKNHAKYFDKEGWLYFTKEVFDLLYPSYGDTYPIFTGAIGMTYEQGGSGRAGKAIIRNNGDTLTLKDRIDHHITTSLSTVEVGSREQARLSQNFTKFFQDARANPKGKYKSYIIKSSNPAGKLKRLTQLLDKNGIEYGRTETTSGTRAFDYRTGKTKGISIGAEDLIISAYQPLSVLTQVLFDPEVRVEDSLTYDVTAWSLPYAYGLEAYATTQGMDVIPGYTFPNAIEAENPTSKYAYLARWESVEDVKFLAELLKKGVKVRFASLPFTIEKESYEAGTLVITRADNRKNSTFDQVLASAALKLNKEITGIETGFSDRGPDLGSDAMRLIQSHKVAVLSDEGVSPYSFGVVWHYFEQVLEYPVDVYYRNSLSSISLDDYHTLILPSGNYNLTDDEQSQLDQWISQGGHLIAIEGAIRSFVDQEGYRLERFATEEEQQAQEQKGEEEQLEGRLDPYMGASRRRISASLPGAIFQLRMDKTHPLAFGIGDQYFTLKTNTIALPLQKNLNNVGTVGKDPLTVGFVGSKALEQLKETISFAVESKGAGHITYMVDNPLFRGFWDNGLFLFSNALFLVGN
ncbi:MAG: zinc carboxypeptidase [Saprospiraceae bacterium]|nr:zinc carboxypeptidase [Saprospiraceae bacterium]